ALRFEWPVRGRVTSRFGWRRTRMHEGVDIAARSGTPVRAAEAGRVIYARRLGGYGKVVVVRHEGRYETVYAHNRRFRVRRGNRVRKGQVIAEVGETGNASAPHLHFEVRRDDDPRDPLLFLP
ncbi:MAG: M23 family metallopeptidase, partial [Myxococcota bacterium]